MLTITLMFFEAGGNVFLVIRICVLSVCERFFNFNFGTRLLFLCKKNGCLCFFGDEQEADFGAKKFSIFSVISEKRNTITKSVSAI